MKKWLQMEGKEVCLELPENVLQSGRHVCTIDDRTVEADVSRVGEAGISLIVNGKQYRCVLDGDAVVIAGRRFAFAVVDPRSLRGRGAAGEGASGPRSVKAPMPGRVVRVLVQEGDAVDAMQGVVVIEAMKMQNELKSPKAGRISRIAAVVDTTVDAGQVLMVVE